MTSFFDPTVIDVADLKDYEYLNTWVNIIKTPISLLKSIT
jgi:hypothetical protein